MTPRGGTAPDATARPLVVGLIAAATVSGDVVGAVARRVAERLTLETAFDVECERRTDGSGPEPDRAVDEGWDITLAVVALPRGAGAEPVVTGHGRRCGSALVGIPTTAPGPAPGAVGEDVLGVVTEHLVEALRAGRFLPWTDEVRGIRALG